MDSAAAATGGGLGIEPRNKWTDDCCCCLGSWAEARLQLYLIPWSLSVHLGVHDEMLSTERGSYRRGRSLDFRTVH